MALPIGGCSSSSLWVQLPIPLSYDLAKFILLGFSQFIHVDAIQQAFSQNLLHHLRFIETTASSGAALRSADQGS